MKKWLRWPGLIAFVVITALLTVVFYFFAGRMIKHAVEFAGTKAVGAKVELSDADISLLPAGFSLSGLQITDPDNPMKNAVEIQHAKMYVDSGGIMMGKLIIDEMMVDGVRFNTERNTSGAIPEKKQKKPEKKKKKKTEKQWEMPSFDIMDPKEVLKKETLSVVNDAEKLKDQITGIKDSYEKQLKSLPDKSSFDDYKTRIKKLKKGKLGFGSILGKAGEIKDLKKDIEDDINALKKVRSDLQHQMFALKKDIKKLKDQAALDYTRLMKKYAISPEGVGNMSALIFGPKYSSWIEKGLTWYMKLKPYLKKKESKEETGDTESTPERGKGINVRFTEYQARPEFLIKKAGLSAEIPAGSLEAILSNVTNEQSVTGVPIRFEITGDTLKGIHSVKAEGTIDRVRPGVESDQVNLSAKGIHIQPLDLTKRDDLAIKLEKAQANLLFNATLSDETIESSIRFDVSSVEFNAGNTSPKGRLAKALGNALSEVKGFSVIGTITGSPENYTVDVSSDLDSIIKKAVSGIAKQLSEEFSKELKTLIDAKTKHSVDDLTQRIGGFSDIEKEINQRLDTGNTLMDSLI